MLDKPKSQVDIKDFPGLATRADPDDVPLGSATRQVNLTCVTPAALTSRPGLREVSFEEDS